MKASVTDMKYAEHNDVKISMNDGTIRAGRDAPLASIGLFKLGRQYLDQVRHTQSFE